MQWDDGRIRLMPGDCRDLIAMLPDNSVDSVVTDPPYEIGFMNLGFDSTGIASDVILWKDILRVLKPGGHVAAFAASRTYHRLACAIEDAGFEIRDQIDWVYASGMPHGSDARLLVDRELGAERTHVAGKGHAGAGYSDTNGFGGSSTANGGKAKSEWDALAPATEQGEQWSGWYSPAEARARTHLPRTQAPGRDTRPQSARTRDGRVAYRRMPRPIPQHGG